MRVAVICDFAEEQWPSMDLVGNMLHASLTEQRDGITSTLVRPRMPLFRRAHPSAFSRACGRFFHYPHELRRLRSQFDVFHITDHSYAHLAHVLPEQRTVVTCHDIDAFRCLIEPDITRSMLFRAISRRVLTGMQRAAHITCVTEATRQDLLAHNLASPEKLSVVHNGVHPALSAISDSAADAELSLLIGRLPASCTELIHVGSTIPRKRIDVLLRVFAALREQRADLRLLRVGGPFTSQQRQLAKSLGVLKYVDTLPRLTERVLAAAYRRAAVLLQTSESEGFGLPVIEAMACGTPVVATDIPPLREVGGDAASYCPLANTSQFTEAVLSLLHKRAVGGKGWEILRNNLLAQARQFTWNTYAARMTDIYSQVVGR